MTSPREGDRVRVTYEAEYMYLDGDGEHFVATGSGERRAWVPVGAVVEVLPKLLKVGDIVTYAAQLDALPDGSVVCRPDQSACPIGKRRGVWRSGSISMDVTTVAAWSDATVLRVGASL